MHVSRSGWSDVSGLSRCSVVGVSNLSYLLFVCDYMSSTVGVLQEACLTLFKHPGSPPVFGGVLVAPLFSFLYCVFVFCLSSSCVLCVQRCLCLWIVQSWLHLRFSQFFFNPFLHSLFAFFWTFFDIRSIFKIIIVMTSGCNVGDGLWFNMHMFTGGHIDLISSLFNL